MKRTLTILGALVISASTTDSLAGTPPDPSYGWTISSSGTDPFQNTGSLVGGTAYLWFVCGDFLQPVQDGMSAAEFAIVTQPPAVHFATIPQNGFLNAGNTDELLLAAPQCPAGPVVAARLLVSGSTTPEIGLGKDGTGTKVTVDCTDNPSGWPVEWTGFNAAGKGDPRCEYFCFYCDSHFGCRNYTIIEPPCPPPNNCDDCTWTPVDAGSWGFTKAKYRE